MNLLRTIILIVSFVVLSTHWGAVNCKRGGARSRLTKLGTTIWGRRSRNRDNLRRHNNGHQPSEVPPIPPPPPPPSSIGKVDAIPRMTSQHQKPPPYGWNAPNQNPYNAHQPFPGYFQTGHIGVVPPRGVNHGHYYNSISGLGGVTHLMGPPHHYTGRKSGLFGGNAFRNVLAGVFIWHLMSGLTRQPYHVYNYYHQPNSDGLLSSNGQARNQLNEITLPSNSLVQCSQNATMFCLPGTISICTTNQTILCIAGYAATGPCSQLAYSGGLCVNATVVCDEDSRDPLCKNANRTEPLSINSQRQEINSEGQTITDNKNGTTTAIVNVPCFTNLTFQENGEEENDTDGEVIKFCVTMVAVPDDHIVSDSTTLPPTNALLPESLPTTISTLTADEDVTSINVVEDLLRFDSNEEVVSSSTVST